MPYGVATVLAIKALLSFPPDKLSWPRFWHALSYRDFQEGFRNGLIMTVCHVILGVVAPSDPHDSTGGASRCRRLSCARGGELRE